jgi:threonine/homoserine/homoserine lactone efflux protein
MLELGIAYIVAVIMPGPSVALVIKNGILHSRLASLQTSFGIIAGTALQLGAILTGLNFVSDYPAVVKGMKIACSSYLIYLGLKSILSFRTKGQSSLIQISDSAQTKIKKQSYFVEGLLVEILNPLAFTFFISILAINYNPQQALLVKFIYWLELVLLASLWFITLSLMTSLKTINTYTKKYNRILDIAAGVLFIFFGLQQLLG